jgi:hypothetical protein
MEMRGTMRAIITLLLCAGALLAQDTYHPNPVNPVTISSSGTDVFVGTVTVPTGEPFALANLARYSLCANADSDGASSLNLNSAGAKALKKVGTAGTLSDTAATDIKSGVCYVLMYNSSADAFQIVSQVKATAGLQFKDEGGSDLPTSTVNCVGAGIACTNSAGTTTVTVAGGSGGGTVTVPGSADTISTAGATYFATKVTLTGAELAAGKVIKVRHFGVWTANDSGAALGLTIGLCPTSDCSSGVILLNQLSDASGAGASNYVDVAWHQEATLFVLSDGTTLLANVEYKVGATSTATPPAQTTVKNRGSKVTIAADTTYYIGLRNTGTSWSGESATLHFVEVEKVN